MPDILSQGGGRESGPWPRRVAAVAVLALVAVLIVHYLPQSRHRTARPARAAVTVTPPPAVSSAVSGDAGVVAEPDGITGRILSWPGGLRLPATGERPVWFWPATGQVMPIGGLPPQRSGYQFTRAAGGWAVQADPAAQAGCGSCAGPQRAVYFLADSGRSATRAGLADAVAPGVPGTLWLTSYPPDAAPRTAAGVAREVSIAGRQLGSQVRLPAGYLIEQGTSRGLLLAPVASQAGTIADKLWNPAAPQASRTFAGDQIQNLHTTACDARRRPGDLGCARRDHSVKGATGPRGGWIPQLVGHRPRERGHWSQQQSAAGPLRDQVTGRKPELRPERPARDADFPCYTCGRARIGIWGIAGQPQRASHAWDDRVRQPCQGRRPPAIG